MRNKNLHWFIMICAISAFQIKGIGKGNRIMDFLALIVIISLLILYAVYQRKTLLKGTFRIHIILIFISLFLSDIMAQLFNKQAMILTIYEQRVMYFFILYFLLLYLAPEPKLFERMILILTFIYCVLYIIQKGVYPLKITDSMVFVDRGTVRIFMPGASIMVISYFIAFQRIFEKFTWFIFSILMLTAIVAVLIAGRQLLIALVVISYVNLLINKRIKNRFAYIIIFMIAIAILGYLMKDIINEMIIVSQKTSQQGSNYVRVRAAKYFISKFQRNEWTYLFGNGEPTERSSYGTRMTYVGEHLGFYFSDLGLLGAYVRFGLIYAITILAILAKILFSKIDSRITYLKNYMYSVVITMFTTGLVFAENEGITAICYLLYTYDYYKNLPKSDPNKTEAQEEVKINKL